MFKFFFGKSKSEKCEWLPDSRKGLMVYIGMPLESPRMWKRAGTYNDEMIRLDDNTAVNPREVRSFLVVYPNMEVLNGKNIFEPLPAGVTCLKPGLGSKEPLTLNAEEIQFGRSIIEVQHTNFRRDASGKLVYSTKIRNISNGPVRITCFAGFGRVGNKYVLTTVTGKFYSAEQFIAWYGAPKDGWIASGQTVADDNNYGGGKGIWAYFGETEKQEPFIGVAELPW